MRFRLILLALGACALLALAGSQGSAQTPTNGATSAPSPAVVVPRFMDPRVRLERPEQLGLRAIRFLTDDEFPPLHFADPDGQLAGFSVDLARAVCEKLAIACTIQARRFDTLLESLTEGRGDVVAAAIQVTPDLRQRFLTGAIHHRMPARFMTETGKVTAEVTPERLKGRKVAVVAGSAHEAFLRQFFAEAQAVPFETVAEAITRLRGGEAEFVFADGLTLALWLGSQTGKGYGFTGGPYLESRYFGEGIGFIMRPDDSALRRSLDYALQQLWDDGTYARLYLRYFPVGLY